MKRSNDAIVGGVVLFVIALTIGAVVWMREADVTGRQREIIARFHDVGNARVGNAVVIRGVVAGRIQGIELGASGWVNVRMKLERDIRLPSQPVVLLNESSLFGDWQATVVSQASLPDDDALRREVDEAAGDVHFIPGASLPGIGKLTAVAGQIAGDVASVAGRVGTAFDEQAATELRASIRNVAELSATLRAVAAAHADDVDTLSSRLNTTIVTLSRAAQTVEHTANSIDSAASSDETKRLVSNAAVAAAELRSAASQLHDLSVRLESTQAKADHFLSMGDSVLSKLNRGEGTLGLLLNDPSLYRRADSLMTAWQVLGTDIRANPKKYISVRLF